MNRLRIDALRQVALGTAIVCSLFAVRFFVIGRPRTVVLMGIITAVQAAVWFVRVSSRWMIHLVVGIDLFIGVTLPSMGGGQNAPVRFAIAIVPMIAAYVGGLRAGLVWFVLSAAGAVVQHALLTRFPQSSEWQATELDYLLGQIALVALFAVASLAARREGDRLLDEAHTRSEALAVANAHAAELMVELAEQQVQLEASTEELLVARDEAMAAVRAKDAFVANVSHELRTPLHGILAAADLLDASSAPVREVSTMLRTSGTRLLGTINDVLSLSKSAAGADETRAVETNLLDLVEDCLVVAGPTAVQRDLVVTADFEPSVPEVVWLDRDKLAHVLTNLVGNAVKFTPRGEVTVGVGPAPGGVRLSVRDMGPGVPRAQRARIFEPFVQADAASARPGTGLGLAIARRFVEAMRGTIEVGDAPSGGAEFVVTLPCRVGRVFRPTRWEVRGIRGGTPGARAALRRQLTSLGAVFDAAAGPWLALGTGEAHEGEEIVRLLRLDEEPQDDARVLRLPITRRGLAAMSEEAGASRPLVLQDPLVVLVVDDDPINRRVASRFLQALGHTVYGVATAAEGRRVAVERQVDVIFLDRRLSGEDGLSLLRELRASGNGAFVVLLTADPTAGEEARASGADAFLVKPASLADFRRVLAGPGGGVREAGLDLTKVKELRGAPPEGGKTLLAELAEALEIEGRETLSKLRAAVSARSDLAALAALAHRFVGASGTVGLERVSVMARRMEEAARRGEWPTAADVDALEVSLHVGLAALRGWFGAWPAPR